MKHFELSWVDQNGESTYSQGWAPEAAPLAVVCLVHGLGEHSGRYAYTGSRLASKGFVVMAIDLPGHGKSSGKRGHVASYDLLLNQVDRLLEKASNRYPGKPLFLYGHSLGGLLVLFYALKRKPDLTGVVATSPGLRTPLEDQQLKIALSKAFGIILPTICLPSGLKANDISRDLQVVQDYLNDPLVHDQVSFGFARVLLDMVHWTLENASEFGLPLLIMHGTDDKIAYAHGSEEFAGMVRCECSLKLFEGLYHETHNEPEKDIVIDTLIEWLMSKI